MATESSHTRITEKGFCIHGNRPNTCSICTNERQDEHAPSPEHEMGTEYGINKFFLSKEFFESLTECPDEARDKVVGLALEYYLMDPVPEHVAGYLRDTVLRARKDLKTGHSLHNLSQDRHTTMIKHLLTNNKLETETETGKRKAFSFITKLAENGYIYHGFNGIFKKSIEEHGLQPDTRQWEWQDLKPVDTILKKVGEGMGLGWANMNSKGKISLGDEPANIYRYAVASPEWFAQFVAEGWHIPVKPPYDKDAFYRKDYLAARRNVELFCDRKMTQSTPKQVESRQGYPNMTEDEKEQVLAFFEKYWKEICNERSKPAVAVIKKSAINMTPGIFSSYDEWIEWVNQSKYRESSIEEYARQVLSSRYIDTQIEHAIPPEDITIIDLPMYQAVHGQQ